MEEVEKEVMIQDLSLHPTSSNLTSHCNTLTGTEMKKPEEEQEQEHEIQDVPLHLIQRNFLSHHRTDKIPDRGRNAMVIYTDKGHGNDEHMVLFPTSEKVDALVESHKWDWTEDTSSDTMEALKEIKKQAATKVKQQAKIKKAFSVQSPAFTQHATSSKQQQWKAHGKLKTKPSKFPQVTGYCDTYDWDGHFNLPPTLTFSRERHYLRMARVAEMDKFDKDILLTPEELFDQIDGPEED
ncbi:uncharacterized protein LOC123508042 [Portunus trituberculatus]|uniref:uncharacterized protein LOC123508042 n=1 Tax=Portunus trituberculatus TaxID=210409 RepID=UPI001E1CC0DE|nr:uncharacterized protein LOC123508042 [Portunus trituberculatus]XP_045117356.1 uncharacterized protein LOC123508042 [Portunus trituberculatus]